MDKMVEKWLIKGYINQDTAKILLNDISETRSQNLKTRLNILIYTIAALFIGIGAISFIAANDWLLAIFLSIPFLKIVVMMILTLLTFWGGYNLVYEARKFFKLGNALIFLAALLIGGTYALIGQQYNFNANGSIIYFVWLISILPVAYCFKNFAVNVLCIIVYVLGVIFYYNDVAIDYGETWTVFIPLLIGISLYTIGNIPIILKNYNDFSLSYKLIGLFPIIITLLILTCSVSSTYHLISPLYIMPLVILLLLSCLNYKIQDKTDILLKVETGFMVLFLIGLICMLSSLTVSVPLVMFLAHLAIITIISFGFYYGYKYEQNNIVGSMNWFLTIYILINYCRWAWDYMDKSAFFMVGGICLLCLGICLEKKRKSILKKGQ